MTSEVLRALSGLTALVTLDLAACHGVTAEGLQTLSSLPALKSLNLWRCDGDRLTKGSAQ